MSSVGETLRAERVRKGLTLEQISRETKISARLLEAIENEQYERLPGGVFAKSFVRQYARILGLNSDELASEVQKSIHPQADQPNFPLAVQEPAYKVPKMKQWEGTGSHSNSSPLGSLVMVLVVMLACAGIYVWWQRSRQPSPAAARPPVTATVSKPAPGPVTPAVSENPAPPPQTPVAAQTEPATAAASNPAATLHVTLAADEPTWVRAWVDGKEAFTATLGPDKMKTADAEGEVRIRTGNAGSLQITVNGKPAGPVGPKGQIRIIQVTNKGVQVTEPPKPAPETDLEPL